jgi:hypothetical protein
MYKKYLILTSGTFLQDALSLQTHKEKAAASWKESVRKGCNLLLKSEMHRGDTNSLSGTGLQSFCLGATAQPLLLCKFSSDLCYWCFIRGESCK